MKDFCCHQIISTRLMLLKKLRETAIVNDNAFIYSPFTVIKNRYEDDEELAPENVHKNHGMTKLAYLVFSVIAIFASSVNKTMSAFQVFFSYIFMFITKY